MYIKCALIFKRCFFMRDVQELVNRRPKYMILADVFREQITSGRLAKNARLQPDSELARKYKVNARTIAASLNILAKEGLLERAPRRGTIVIKDYSAGVISTNAVGMVMMNKGDVYSNIARNIAKGFRENKLFPVVINSDVILDRSCIVNFLQGLNTEKTRPYGFIIEGSLNFPFEFLKQNIDKFHNIVFINRYHHPEKIKKNKYVLIDFPEAGRLAAKHFIAQGHKKLSCLAMRELSYASPWSSMQVQIMQGFAEVCQENNIQFNDEIFWKLLHGAPLTDTVSTLISGTNRPDAIFSYNDAFMRYELLPLLGNIKDIELIGFYNTHHAEECGFSSICIHEERIAKNAVKLLTNKTTEKEVLIKPELIVRT